MAEITNSRQLTWTTRDLILATLLIIAIMSLLNLYNGGIQQFIATTDKPSAVFGDFCEYYYPAGRMILSHPEPLGGYFYTPAFALLLSPFAPDSAADAMTRWQILQHLGIILLLIVPAVWLATRGGRKIWFFLYIFFFITSFPLWHNLKWGQMSIIITLACIAALYLHERGRLWPAALMLTAASLVKYYPGALIFYFLIRRDIAFVARFACCMLVLGILFPAAFLGLAATIEFYRLINAEMAYALDWVAFDLNSQFLPHVITRLAGIQPDAVIRGLLSLMGLTICLVAFYKMHQLHLSGKHDQTLAASGIFLLFPLLINTSWPHYFVFLPFCAVLLLQNAQTAMQRNMIFTAMVLQSFAIFIVTSYQFFSGNGFLLMADLLLLAVWFSLQKAPPGSDLAGQNPEVF